MHPRLWDILRKAELDETVKVIIYQNGTDSSDKKLPIDILTFSGPKGLNEAIKIASDIKYLQFDIDIICRDGFSIPYLYTHKKNAGYNSLYRVELPRIELLDCFSHFFYFLTEAIDYIRNRVRGSWKLVIHLPECGKIKLAAGDTDTKDEILTLIQDTYKELTWKITMHCREKVEVLESYINKYLDIPFTLKADIEKFYDLYDALRKYKM